MKPRQPRAAMFGLVLIPTESFWEMRGGAQTYLSMVTNSLSSTDERFFCS
ncbi:hypothetical protein JOD20_003921 [Herpetosiphon giganteus]|nr:hypothetical protein [Herpetosiphon giganteus]